MNKKININVIKAIFGLQDDVCLGRYIWTIHQMAASLSRYYEPIFGLEPKRCLITYAIDQDPYFRGIRDKAEQLNSYKPCAIISQFLPALEGNAKMSSTQICQNKTIYMTDDPNTIFNTIKKYAFSGCKQTLAEHKIHGANLSTDISYQYLRYFMFDDDLLLKIAQEYSTGKMNSIEVKKILSDILKDFLTNHQEKRKNINKQDIEYFYDITKFEKKHYI